MNSLSLKIKVPLFFLSIVILTFIIYCFIGITIYTHKVENGNKKYLTKLAAESTYELLTGNSGRLNSRILLWLKDEQYIKSILYIDDKFNIIANADIKKIGTRLSIDCITKILENHILTNKPKLILKTRNKQTYAVPIYYMDQNIGYLIADIRPFNIFNFVFRNNYEIKFTLLLAFIAGALIILITSYFLSKRIVDPIMQINKVINSFISSDEFELEGIPINHLRFKKSKHCTVAKNKIETGKMCWEHFLDDKGFAEHNPLSIPCFECPVFLINEGDEIKNLTLFLNQFIFSTKHHFFKKHAYSQSLEKLVKKRTHKLLSETKKTLSIINNIIEGILVTDSQGKIIQINHNAIDLLKIKQSRGNLINKNILNIIEDDAINRTIKQSLALFENDSSSPIELELADSDNQYIKIKSSCVEQGQDNKQALTIHLIEDITNTKLLEHFKTEIFHTISHDLKNPLTSIMGYVDLTLSGSENKSLSKNQTKYLKRALSSSEDMQVLIQNLMNVIKLQSAKIKLDKINFLIKDLFQDIKDVFYPIFDSHDILQTITVNPNDLQIKADYFRLKEALSNIISNSIKASRNITITTYAEKKHNNIILKIVDNGPGIPKEKLRYIFEKFTQLSTYKDSSEGLGIGLSIVKSIINLHNGTISVESEPSKGTIFTIILPQ